MSVIHDRKWLETELTFGESMYQKLKVDCADEIDLPSLLEFFEEPEEYIKIYDTFEEQLLMQFQIQYAEALAEEKKTKQRKFESLTMTDDEKIEAYLKYESEPVYVPPATFEEDRAKLRDFLGSQLCSYIRFLGNLHRIILKEFIDFDVISYLNAPVSDDDCLPISS